MYTNKEAIKVASDLIRIRSTKDNQKGREDVLAYVQKYFEGECVHIRKYEKNGVGSLVITLKKEKHPYLFLNGHLDVVSAKEVDFKPKVEGDKLYGRGSGDMKGAVAVMMMLIKHLSRKKKKPSVGLMLTTDEEVGGRNGVGHLVNDKGYRAEFLIVPDGGKHLGQVVVNQKGVVQIKITAHGKAAHGSQPHLGENAIEKLFIYYQAIQQLIPPMQKTEWKSTLNLGKIEGGANVNAVPDRAEMCLDIRFTKQEEREKLLKKIREITDGNVEIISEGNPFSQSENHPLVKRYMAVASRYNKGTVKTTQEEGASDARFFSEKNIPTVITTLVCGNIHGDGEWVSTSDMGTFYAIVSDFVEELGI